MICMASASGNSSPKRDTPLCGLLSQGTLVQNNPSLQILFYLRQPLLTDQTIDRRVCYSRKRATSAPEYPIFRTAIRLNNFLAETTFLILTQVHTAVAST
jgi:hypothetical protein